MANAPQIKSNTDASLHHKAREAVTVLSFHGVIDAGSINDVKIAGTMFKDWFMENYTQEIEMQIYISYAKEDQEMAKRLYDDLNQVADIAPWMVSENLIKGQNTKLMIRKAIKESSFFLALLSVNSVSNRGLVHKELRIALDMLDELPDSEVFVIPVKLNKCEIFDEKLDDLYPVDLFLSYETALKDILKALGKPSDNIKITPPKKEHSPDPDPPEKETAPDKPEKKSSPVKAPVHSTENANCFSWLHFTDLHRGMAQQKWLWPGVKHILFEDLKHTHDKTGPWDIVLFTGDLTQKGSAEEFQNIDEILNELWECFRRLGSAPKLLAVPGNHDLVRPTEEEKGDPAFILLSQWEQQATVRDHFWNNTQSDYHRIIGTAFENYKNWWDRQPFKPDNLTPGTLPGDFSVTIEKGNAKLGIVGLNSAFLQLTGDDYKGKLAMHASQFHKMCGNDGPIWAQQHHTCLLLTHHPPGWLNDESKKHLKGEIVSHGRFAVHLCGHLHETAYSDISEGGSDPRRIWQGRSLFGLEYFAQKEERLHGYTAGKIKFDNDKGDNNKGELLFWPREAREQGGQRKIVPDYSLDLNNDQHTNPKVFDLLQSC
ncbi:MAG: TIR domain-containing protein [Desulfobacteraceae bacterium]|nr:TIR domain-containing protein [Desulfobacteraceae bacterium]